ncbi:hypothetical protein G7K_1001-t3 [Saitoella complicata NRRL Y-17804]|uniref:Uncharacterized protein n=1 Tax=Saitoella complicata (strain BCRC 22490 / CBS 7301 / JCM 7358 / NBRC 10748 / NRRL Y-17804) TaxID=698492 RepID=A0A0E9NA69_SAICN|nr:hypothetical protein G7K_1001-t3 [Saitoella complicata NRRL Y-17804]
MEADIIRFNSTHALRAEPLVNSLVHKTQSHLRNCSNPPETERYTKPRHQPERIGRDCASSRDILHLHVFPSTAAQRPWHPPWPSPSDISNNWEFHPPEHGLRALPAKFSAPLAKRPTPKSSLTCGEPREGRISSTLQHRQGQYNVPANCRVCTGVIACSTYPPPFQIRVAIRIMS